MKIAIHGTKDGYRILYTTDEEFARIISRDIRKGAQGDDQLGKTAYSLAFVDNGCAYSKYVIVKDSLRSFSTGTIAFSLFVGANETMKAEDIFKLLNEIYSSYDGKYIRNHYLNRGEKELIREEWSFVKDILSKYKTTPDTTRYEQINSGTKAPAFIYYQDDNKLLEYFDKPFQEEYNDYSQILLIKSTLKGEANPINVLKTSGKELNVDLKNDYFYLNNYNRSKGLTIIANGKLRSEEKNNNFIRAKEKIQIKYTRDYYKPIEVTGTLFDHDSDIYNYLEIKGTQIIIKYDVLSNDLKPIEKPITFSIKYRKGKLEKDAEITCNSSIESKSVINNEVTFQGEEIGQHWTISAKKGDNLFSDVKKIIPENESYVELVLNEHKKVKFVATDADNENDISGFKVWVQGKVDTRNIEELEFIGEEVYKTWNITFEAENYDRSAPVNYAPSIDKPTIHIKLKPRKKSQQPVEINESISVAQYVKKEPFYQSPNFIAGSIVGALVIGFGIWALLSLSENGQPEQNPQTAIATQQIQAYIKGNSLILDTLNYYKETLGEEQTEILNSLDSTIKKRESIDDRSFSELKRLVYYPAQQKFKTAILKIDSTQYTAVKDRLGNISSLNLNQIADSINAILNAPKPIAEKKPEEEKKVIVEKKEEPQKEIAQSTKPEQNKDEKLVSPPANTNNIKDITKELQSGTVTKDELKNWKTAGMDKYNKSIELYLEFWATIKPGMQKEDSDQLLKRINADKYLQKSALQSFLKSVCGTSESFTKYNDTPGKATCKTINELRDKVK